MTSGWVLVSGAGGGEVNGTCNANLVLVVVSGENDGVSISVDFLLLRSSLRLSLLPEVVASGFLGLVVLDRSKEAALFLEGGDKLCLVLGPSLLSLSRSIRRT